MLRAALSRPSVLRQINSSSSIWRARRYVTNVDPPRPNSSTTPPNGFQAQLQTWTTHATTLFRSRADGFTTAAKGTFSQLGSQLNKVTGYEEIEALKKQVAAQEARIVVVREAAREAKSAYEEAVVQRSKSQREVNDLLQRKSTWIDADVGRFTDLVRQDHTREQEEAAAKAAVQETDHAVDQEFTELMRSILARYHEEQVWSDKIRSASTYGSLAALGLNMLIFVMAILVVEPWKRKRLAQTFEQKIVEMSEENRAVVARGLAELGQQLQAQEALFLSAKEAPIPIVIEEEKEEEEEKNELGLTPALIKRVEGTMIALSAGAAAIGILDGVNGPSGFTVLVAVLGAIGWLWLKP